MAAIEHDNLEEFRDPILYDIEETYYDPDGPFIEALARETGGPLLDLACGTGRLAIPYAKFGYAVTGVDLALPMIEHARRKAADEGVAVRFVHGDARSMDLDGRFGLVYMTGNAFQAFLSPADQRAVLAAVRVHLAEDGIFVFGTRAPIPAHLETCLEETIWNRYAAPDGRAITVSGYQRYDPATQVQHWTTLRSWRTASGDSAVNVTRIAIRYAESEELTALLRGSGFAVRSRYGSWLGEPYSGESESMIFVCARA